MKAIQIDCYGGPQVLVRRDVPIPAPTAGKVLIQLAWSGINFMDIHTRQGKYAVSQTYPQALPTTLGVEGAGTIVALGEGVKEFSIGDRVAYCLVWGSYAEFAVVEAWRVVRVPDELPLDVAAASMFHGLTAHYLAYDLGRLGPGVTCLVHAASGGIGQLLIQLGARSGATVFATTSTPGKATLARLQGATTTFYYGNGAFAEEIREITGGRGVDVVFDPIGLPTLRHSMRATRTRGLVIAFGSVAGNVKDFDPIELGEAGSLFLTRPRLADYLPDAATIRGRAADVFSAIGSGAVSVQVSGRYTLENVQIAHDALEERRGGGKPLLQIASRSPDG